jgi:hypothetical protein
MIAKSVRSGIQTVHPLIVKWYDISKICQFLSSAMLTASDQGREVLYAIFRTELLFIRDASIDRRDQGLRARAATHRCCDIPRWDAAHLDMIRQFRSRIGFCTVVTCLTDQADAIL